MAEESATRPAFEVLGYSAGALSSQFSNRHASAEVIGKKRQVKYLQDYLDKVQARTLLVEHLYVDRDYLEDFSAYYVRCFANYDRRCKRLHFFSIDFSAEVFQGLVSGDSTSLAVEKLQDSYLGFVVVKPLPDTVIGRTCLVTYPDDGERHYEIVRDYEVNLFGMPLKARNTLAFQEQDSVVAACASSALWSAFHGTCRRFGHRLPSPAEITVSAGAKSSDVDRNLPSKGLTWSMMADAIRYVGLEPLYSQPADDSDLKAVIYAYVRGGIPAILGFYMHDPKDEAEAWQKKLHAVAVSGYRIPESSIPIADKYGFRLFAYRLDRLFVHDDQVGPFARMFVDGHSCSVTEDGKQSSRRSLGTLYLDEDGEAGNVRAIEPVVLLPLYHKIRIPYALVHDTVFQLSAVFLSLVEGTDWEKELEWDIFLTTGNAFKEELGASTQIESSRKFRYLTQPLPRFVWRARALVRGTPVLDLLFDATDIEQGTLFSMVVEYDKDLVQLMPQIFGDIKNKALFGDTTAGRIVDWYVAAESSRT